VGSNSVIITTVGNTDINGGLIANIDGNGVDGGNLSISTGSLSYRDIEEQDHYWRENNSFGVSNLAFGRRDNNVPSGSSGQAGNYYPRGSLSIGESNEGYEKERITRATLGNGSITIGGESISDDSVLITGLNRDIDKSQEVTKDIKTGGSSYSLDVDLRLLSEEGREDIVNDFAATRDGALDLKNNAGYLARGLFAENSYERGLINYERQQYNINRSDLDISSSKQYASSSKESMDFNIRRNAPEANAYTPDGMLFGCRAGAIGCAAGAVFDVAEIGIVALSATKAYQDLLKLYQGTNPADQGFVDEGFTGVEDSRPNTISTPIAENIRDPLVTPVPEGLDGNNSVTDIPNQEDLNNQLPGFVPDSNLPDSTVLENRDHQYIPAPTNLPAFPELKESKPKTYNNAGKKRKRWKDNKGRIYEWDSQHGTIEKYNKTGKKHLGEFDPSTGRRIKPPDSTKTVEP